MPPRRLIRRHERATSPLIWLGAILCAAFAIAVIIACMAVLAAVIIYHPKVPRLRVADGHLNRLDYAQSGVLSTDLSLKIVAENDNKKANVSFSEVRIFLDFSGIVIADLRAAPFDVPKNKSLPLPYAFLSTIPLDLEGMAVMDTALKQGIVPFDVKGQARTRWRVGIFPSVRFWVHIECQLQFFWPNGTVADFGGCRSKYH